ncbi:long-chain fatty acid--CoA ligase [Chitinophaga ginsengisegetis]|uniref:AMP-dependent synthetase/ligase n=1 Tax=Chitinophaga ginsengisegetis TaxID=393003 RepID=UPI000DB9FFC2|nr:long-chain fatty acid--CoA ligase [Chitinophaga ginsengisegetis]MDR6570354.1 long-chain acyl-CoA synthetase [Chitinophaga ginsengisegetis]MDR6650088.1 long-chain acyl-CoA synthetase [Chitinophaga ginsengisegetis]MDR6656271.1 long-chain acyl-CoA synthetase [Chitinophaga ginsengisegetis]
MDQPQRLFDVISYQLANFPKEDMLAGKENGQWKKYSTKEVADLTLRFSSGLLKLGIRPGIKKNEEKDKIAIISPNRPEWIITDLACQQLGAVLTPIYPTISETELAYVLNDAEARILFVSDKDLLEKVNAMRDKFPSIREIFTFNKVEGARHWTEIPALADTTDFDQINEIKKNISPEELVTIIYTSGTTGTPKGVMLSHHNVISNVLACQPYLPVNKEAKALSFLPLNHIFERMVTYLYLRAGVPVYYAESMETIGDNLKEVKPTIFTTVPRLLEKVYEKIMTTGLELKGIKRALFFWAVDIGKRYEINKDQGAWYNLQLKLANKLVFSKWRAALGGNIQCIVNGAAACQVRLLKIFTAGGIPILEGYGLTETSPVISVNRFNEEDRMFGTVGPVINGVEVKLAEDGEILCKGPNVTIGYYKRPDLTADAIKDGWFHTGDIGVMIDNKFLKITDRKKELFKTSGGKFVAPQPIENKFKESPYIEQIMIVGEDRKFTAALIVPSFSNLRNWAQKRGITTTSNEELVKNPDVQDLYKQAVDKYNQFFSHIEQVKKYILLPHEWTVDNGELTPTLKAKRKVILEKFKKEIDSIYAPAGGKVDIESL